jgi:hypothetical protein
MFTTKLARILLVLGAGLGIAGVAVAALELRINVPDWMIQVAMIKLALAGSLGLLGAGAMLGRHAKRQASLENRDRLALGERDPDLHDRVQRAVSEQVHQTPDRE